MGAGLLFLNVIFQSMPWTDDIDFVLRHPNLNLQNILVHPMTWEVIGIFDSEYVSFSHPAVGYASPPLFLRGDWVRGYTSMYRPDPDSALAARGGMY